jgi:hypothetical protein
MDAHTIGMLLLGGVGLGVTVWVLHKIGKTLLAVGKALAAGLVAALDDLYTPAARVAARLRPECHRRHHPGHGDRQPRGAPENAPGPAPAGPSGAESPGGALRCLLLLFLIHSHYSLQGPTSDRLV